MFDSYPHDKVHPDKKIKHHNISYILLKVTLNTNKLLLKYFYLLAPIFVVSAKGIDPWVLEFMVSNTTGNKWGNCISLDFNFRALSEPQNP